MNNFIEILNKWGGIFLDFAWPMLWQSSLLILVLFAFEFLFRRIMRASLRYALWLVVLIKLCVPPTLALPTSPTWWLHKAPPPVAAKPETHYTVSYNDAPSRETPQFALPTVVPPKPAMTNAAWLLIVSTAISSLLLFWLLVRWWQISRQVHRAHISDRLAALADETQKLVSTNYKLQVKLTNNSMSPAVCGLVRPAILIPQSLLDSFSNEQLRAVLLHELIHLRRRDVWLNFFQALLQITYWWHPLVWLANSRIRRVREEAVDDAVMLALRDEAESYAPTLLEVAKLAFNRPLATLGLVGILESRHALRQRIERLIDFRPPRQAGLTLVSLLGILAFTTVAVPMGEKPAPAESPSAISTASIKDQSLTMKVNPEIFIRNVKAQAAKTLLPPGSDYTDILLDLLRSEGVDSNPPHGLAFNTVTGEITTQNTPEQLEIFRQVIEQLNRTDGICELPLRNNFHRKSVLIEARIYQLPADDFKNIVSGLQFYRSRQGSDAWWSVMPEKFKQFVDGLESSGLQLIQRPRILTGSGMPALFYVGSGTNSVEFECKPYARDGFVELTVQSTVISGPPANAFTNHFRIQASALDHGGIVVRAENLNGDAGSNLLVVISMEIVTNQMAGGLPASNSIKHFRKSMTFKLSSPLSQNELKKKLLALGVKPPTTTFFNTNSGVLMVRGSKEQLELVDEMVIKMNGDWSKKTDANNDQFIKEITTITSGEPPFAPETNLISRHFRVNAYLFTNTLQNTPGLQADNISTMAKSLFSQLGVNMGVPGTAVFYNDGLGELFVRASSWDMDTVERAMGVLTSATPQVHIKARFLEVPKGTLSGIQNIQNLTNTNDDKFVGILSGTNSEAFLRAPAMGRGIEYGEPEVITTSGRQTVMRATQVITVVTNTMFEEKMTNVDGTIVSNSISFKTTQMETGPVFDVVPIVLSDGLTINLSTTASQVEFFGYADIPTNAPGHSVTNSAGHRIDLPLVWPAMQISRVSANVNLRDGQTLVLLSNPPEQVRFAAPDEQREAVVADYISDAQTKRKNDETENIVFITATLVEPAGNRIHSD